MSQMVSLENKLIEEKLISKEQLHFIKEEKVKTNKNIKNILIDLGYLQEKDFISFLSREFSLPILELNEFEMVPELTRYVPHSIALKYTVIPIFLLEDRLICAMSDPLDILALESLRNITQLQIEPVIALEKEIKECIEKLYTNKIKEDQRKEEEEEIPAKKKEEESEIVQSAAIRLVNLIIEKGAQERASDIHLEPQEDLMKVRFRIDGVLLKQPAIPKKLQNSVISRIKIMADLDISEKRIPQDGRLQYNFNKRDIDIRVSTVPTVHGETIVLRLLDSTASLVGLKEIGFPDNVLEIFSSLISQPHGIILITGPTGSGKSTTLYSSIAQINDSKKNIITIEDPVEYRIPGIQQIQVNPKVDLTFSNGLRSILRQDPDVIMIGEIRDKETAEIAIQAALTGHLVLSTIHTNDAASSITRLVDMGIEPFLIGSSLVGSLAQRLVRKICEPCKGKGCKQCNQVGFSGRIGIFELLQVDDNIRALITAKKSAEEISEQGIKNGMRRLIEDGQDKVKNKITTQEEILRVTMNI